MRIQQFILNGFSFTLLKLDLSIKLECMVNLEEILLFISQVFDEILALIHSFISLQTYKFLEIVYLDN